MAVIALTLLEFVECSFFLSFLELFICRVYLILDKSEVLLVPAEENSVLESGQIRIRLIFLLYGTTQSAIHLKICRRPGYLIPGPHEQAFPKIAILPLIFCACSVSRFLHELFGCDLLSHTEFIERPFSRRQCRRIDEFSSLRDNFSVYGFVIPSLDILAREKRVLFLHYTDCLFR